MLVGVRSVETMKIYSPKAAFDDRPTSQVRRITIATGVATVNNFFLENLHLHSFLFLDVPTIHANPDNVGPVP
jgi:hypothetical protein